MTSTASSGSGSGAVEKTTKAPRPPNSWIIYRSDKMREMTAPHRKGSKKGMTQADLSRVIADMWKTETDSVRAEYERRAEIKKAEHYARFPNYRFQPVKKEEKEKERRLHAEKPAASSSSVRRAKPQPTPQPPVVQQQQQQPPPVAPKRRTPPPATTATTKRATTQVEQYGPCGPSPPASAASTPEFMPVFDDALPEPTPLEIAHPAYPPMPTPSEVPLRPMTPPETNFTVPPELAIDMQTLANWQFNPDPNNLANSLQNYQFDMTTNQLTTLDGAPLTSAPQGEFELSLGHFPPMFFPDANGDDSWGAYFLDTPNDYGITTPNHDSPMSPIHAPVPQSSLAYIDSWSASIDPSQLQDISQEPTPSTSVLPSPDPDPSHPSRSPSSPSASSPIRTTRSSPRPHPYHPPPGAPKHGQRRAGGTWRPPVNVRSVSSGSYTGVSASAGS